MTPDFVLVAICLLTAMTLLAVVLMFLFYKGADRNAIITTLVGFTAPTIGVLLVSVQSAKNADRITEAREDVTAQIGAVRSKQDKVHADTAAKIAEIKNEQVAVAKDLKEAKEEIKKVPK